MAPLLPILYYINNFCSKLLENRPYSRRLSQAQKMKIPSMLPLLSSPFYTFFSSLSSSFKGVFHRKYFYCSNVHSCSYEHSLWSAWRCQGQRGPVPSSWAQHPMLPVPWPGVSWRLPVALGPHVSNDLQPSPTNFLSSPASGRWPQWDHQRGSASRRLDGAVEGLRAGLACSRSPLAVLNNDLFSMSWHTPRVPFLASPLTYGCVLAFLARCVTAPRVVWRLPVALRSLVSNDLLSVRA